MSAKMFPLQTERGSPTGPRQIPWSIAELAYGEYSKRYGSSQSLERLAERGGFGWGEMDEYYPNWRKDVSEIEQLKRQLSVAQAQNLAWIRWANNKGYEHSELNDQTTAGIKILDEIVALKERIRKQKFCPECGCEELIPFVEATEKGHCYCQKCKQEIFETVDYSQTIATNLKQKSISEHAADIQYVADRLVQASEAKSLVEERVKILLEAGRILLRVSLPPHDVSGSAMFEKAAQLFREPSGVIITPKENRDAQTPNSSPGSDSTG